jgi:acylphosphatase
MKQTARRIVFRGQVQGVGFRYTVCEIADGLALTGFVRNRPDGTVEALLQGRADRIDECVSGIAARFGAHIRDMSMSETPVNPGHTGFQITY